VIPYGQHYLDDEDIAAVVNVLRQGVLTQGPKIAEFEEAVAAYVGARYAVALSSGTAALHLACVAANLGPADRLATSPLTFVASANCARYVGASPVLADIAQDTLNLSPEALREAAKAMPGIRAVVAVHFAGLPCDMTGIRDVAEQAGMVVIEDAAHALGATYPSGRRVGSCENSSMTVFSFHPVKSIAAGEGGMITTNDQSIYRRLLRLRSHGINKDEDQLLNIAAANEQGEPNLWYYEMQELGWNYRITDIQSALALSQLGKLERFLERRRQLAVRYDRLLKDLPGLQPAQRDGRASSAHHIYPVLIDFSALGTTRTRFMMELRRRGIGTQVHYVPLHMHPYYQQLGIKFLSLSNAESYYRQALSLPLYYSLTDAQQDEIVVAIKDLLS
jgi:perosamine synthetase